VIRACGRSSMKVDSCGYLDDEDRGDKHPEADRAELL
jgi:hypothetical protein